MTRGMRRMLDDDAAASEAQAQPRSGGGLLCCCCTVGDIVVEAQMTAAAMRAPAPLLLEPGYAHERGAAQGLPPPTTGAFEVAHKEKGEGIIAVMVGANAAELALQGRDVLGHLSTHLRCMEEQTVVHGEFEEGTCKLQIALYHGCKYKSIARATSGTISDNFEFVTGYSVHCRGKNVLLKFKQGRLEPQRGGTASILGARKSVGGGIDMKTNINSIEPIGEASGETR